MGKTILKVLLAVGIVTALSLGSADDAAARTHRHAPPPPHIVQQKQIGAKRFIYFHNTLDKSIYVYIECEQHLTTIPFDVAPERVTELVLPDIDSNEQCMFNHYRIHVPGHSPEPWTPYNSDFQDGGVQ